MVRGGAVVGGLAGSSLRLDAHSHEGGGIIALAGIDEDHLVVDDPTAVTNLRDDTETHVIGHCLMESRCEDATDGRQVQRGRNLDTSLQKGRLDVFLLIRRMNAEYIDSKVELAVEILVRVRLHHQSAEQAHDFQQSDSLVILA